MLPFFCFYNFTMKKPLHALFASALALSSASLLSAADWLTHMNPPEILADGTIRAEVPVGEEGQSFLHYFDPVDMAVGDVLELTWRVRISRFAATNNLARFGFYDSKGERLDDDNAYSHPLLSDYTGLSVFVPNTRANSQQGQRSSVSVHERNLPDPLLVTGRAHGPRLAGVGDGFETLGNNQWSPVQTLRLTRTAAGWEVFTRLGGVDGRADLPAREAVMQIIAGDLPSNRFDTVLLWYRTSAEIQPVIEIQSPELRIRRE